MIDSNLKSKPNMHIHKHIHLTNDNIHHNKQYKQFITDWHIITANESVIGNKLDKSSLGRKVGSSNRGQSYPDKVTVARLVITLCDLSLLASCGSLVARSYVSHAELHFTVI